MAGTWTTNNWLFKPPSGPSYDSSFGTGFDRVDARLAREVWVGDAGRTTLEAALTSIGATNKTVLRVPAGTHTLTTDVDITSNIMLIPDIGAIITLGSHSLNIGGPFNAGLYRVFDCSDIGIVTFEDGVVEYICPEWWYDSAGDYGAAFQAAHDSRPNGGALIALLQGNYPVKTQVNFTLPGIHVRGRGKYASKISFDPAGTATCLKFGDDTSPSTDCSLMDLAILAPDDNAQNKTYVHLADARRFQLRGVNIQNIDEDFDKDSGSIGLYYQGRDLLTVSDCQIICDRPVVFGANPVDRDISLGLVGDGSRFDTVALATYVSNGKNFEIMDNADVYLADLTFRKLHMNLGAYGFYWKPTISAFTNVPSKVRFEDCRYERANAGGVGCLIDMSSIISEPQRMYNLSMINSYWSGTKGIELKNIAEVTLINSGNQHLFGDAEATTSLDVDTSIGSLRVVNCFWPTGALSLGGMTTAFASMWNQITSASGRWDAHYVGAGPAANYEGVILNNVHTLLWKGQLVDDDFHNVGILADMKVWQATVTSQQDGGAEQEVMMCYGGLNGATPVITKSNLVAVGGDAATAHTDVANTDTKLCLFNNSGVLRLRNRLGYTVNVVIKIEWYSDAY